MMTTHCLPQREAKCPSVWGRHVQKRAQSLGEYDRVPLWDVAERDMSSIKDIGEGCDGGHHGQAAAHCFEYGFVYAVMIARVYKQIGLAIRPVDQWERSCGTELNARGNP